ncbi:helix-turn-helix domain-containing protein, partial [Burkholderia gladioli]|nr:helix-turn-helix domain-containing protein [Burkholderia gladioli]
GNVRELRNFVQRASIFNDGELIDTLPPPIMAEVSGEAVAADDTVSVPFGTTLEEVDRRVILGTLAQCGGVKTHAAEVLDISLKTIYNRLAQIEGGEKADKVDKSDKAADRSADQLADKTDKTAS